MPIDKNTINIGEEFAAWRVPEYEKHERTKVWYAGASIIALILLFYAFWTTNFLFAVIIIVSALVIILRDGGEPEMIDVALTKEGVAVGRKFYDYDELKDFSIVYKPNLGVKNLYFEFKSSVKPRLSIPLDDMNPLPIRENLLKYLPEDLERTDQPTSEGLAKLFKL
ncbi:hypothetical protein HY798_03495 [Candidatus Falkowbacteria bacterium]|nr:hypothetical protein [Candidatus Falkowbacteria bacterium]